MQSSRCTVHAWGLIDREGRGDTSPYRPLTTSSVPPIGCCLRSSSCRPTRANVTSLQDNGLTHTTRVVRDWMETQPRLKLLHWVSRSPDMNPIGEHVACPSQMVYTACLVVVWRLVSKC